MGAETLADMNEIVYSDSDLVRTIRDVLVAALSGKRNLYDELIGKMHQHEGRLSPDEVALIVASLKGLSGAVSCIDEVHHQSLLNCIFRMSMWNYEPEVMDALVEFLLSLAVSYGTRLDECLEMLVSNFMPPIHFLKKLEDPLRRDGALARKDEVLSRVHLALKDITDLVPLAPLRLWSIVKEKMPHMWKNVPIAHYVENVFRLESGAIGHLVGRQSLVAMVMDRLIDLDVEIRWEDILQEDCNKGVFNIELDDMDEAFDDDGDDFEQPGGPSTRKSLGKNAIAEKLDSLMVLTFEHLKSCADSARLSEVFDALLQSFEKTVLTAYKSKFAQFVIFYSCSLDPENCGVRFAALLTDIFLNPSSLPQKRMSAVAYLASYLSRGKFVPTSLVFSILQRLEYWCLEYCEVRSGDVNPEAHKVFYSGCQAIMYTLCFRMRSLMGVPHLDGERLLRAIEPILKHPLNPLRVCLPSIVNEFLRQAKAAHLFTISDTFIFDDLLESELSIAFGGPDRLDMFFPFDPCLLKQSDRYIRPNYVFWSMVRITYDDEDGSTDDEDAQVFVEQNGEYMEDGAAAMSFEENGFEIGRLDYSLDKMSITPKNTLRSRFEGQVVPQMQMPSRIRPSTSPESL
ncbi:RNA polymerase I specific transcription initiation factor RRN3 [Dillenia turbinata]|uniref:RNA polymerase I specific transcription initiation factor RRN3 n=1 Tax=Dillenia turbinata TaxID=194707 RepID=A0AAN8VNE6_9MAGN